MNEPRWELPDLLARSSRPGYDSDHVSKATVDSWIAQVRALGISSIICLLPEDQLNYYTDLPSGLIDHYRQSGFEVASVQIVDPAHDEAGWQQIEENLSDIFDHFQRLPKPVLVHCSAGIDRTGRVVSHIVKRLNSDARRGA